MGISLVHQLRLLHRLQWAVLLQSLLCDIATLVCLFLQRSYTLTKQVAFRHPKIYFMLGYYWQKNSSDAQDMHKNVNKYCSKTKDLFTLVRIPQWTVVFPQRERKFSISALTQSTVESTDRYCKCEWPLTLI